jgi:predicted  nucleic acid-binding Zn-ribbon protein
MANKKSWLEIDLNTLEEECFLLPKRFYAVSEEMADARTEVQECDNALELAKAEMKEVEAELTLAIQKDPDKFNLGSKPTVAAVSSAVLTHSKYKTIQDKYFQIKDQLKDAWDKVNHLQGLIASLDKVKFSLESAIKLHGQNYFSTPYVPSTDAGRKYMDDMKKRRARVKKKKK